MLDKLLIHPTTRLQLDAFAKQPPHALLFVGQPGIGKQSLALYWARRATNDRAYEPQVVGPDEKGTITIEVIRGLYRSVRNKREQRQIVIIDHAEAMGDEAQNAFLKLLEEPRSGVTFILTAPQAEALLPTITSRVQQLYVQPLDDRSLRSLVALHAELTPADIAQYLFIAEGRPAKLATLLANPEELRSERTAMLQAKELLTAKIYERLVRISALATSRDDCSAILAAMLRMVSLQIKKSSHIDQTRYLLALATALDETLLALGRNGNLKAQLLKLFTNY